MNKENPFQSNFPALKIIHINDWIDSKHGIQFLAPIIEQLLQYLPDRKQVNIDTDREI